MRFASFCWVLVISAQTVMLAQTNPVPFVNQILDPVSVQPGGKEFLLTVNGTGFSSTAVINWNGSPILTSVESTSRLTAKISAAKLGRFFRRLKPISLAAIFGMPEGTIPRSS